jgi:tetratricopeptide (TPR) repeat protein
MDDILKFLAVSFFTVATVFLGSLYGVSEPLTQKPKQLNSRAFQEKLALHSQRESAEDFYELSLVDIEGNDLSSAKEALGVALRLNPHFIEAKVQRGYISLWEKDYSSANNHFTQILVQDTKNAKALQGLEIIAKIWGQEPLFQKQAIYIYRKLLEIFPSQADYLFNLGRLLAQTRNWKEAEITLKKCLEIAPQYVDAALQLGNLYLWQNRFDEAESIFQKYPENIDAKKNLAKIPMRKGNFTLAEKKWQKLEKEYPEDEEIRYTLAKVYLAQHKFTKALKEYNILIQKPSESKYRELFELKSQTNPRLVLNGDYTDSKENDPSLQKPVVRTFYCNNSLALVIPLYDSWKIDLKPYGGYQKERNIYRTGINYNVSLYGGLVNSHFIFHENWKWDVSLAGIHGENIGNVLAYPFLTTTRVGIGTDLIYHTQSHTLAFDVHPEGLLIKDFARIESKLLSQTYVDMLYNYQFDFFLKPQMEGYIEEVFYSDHIHNRRNTCRLTSTCFLPFWDRTLSLFYEFERRAMPKLSINYYSFRRQWRHVMGVKFYKEVSSRVGLEIFYYHRWQLTRRLFQPIGNFVFVAARQNLTSNRIGATVSYRVMDNCRFELGGHYFRDTLPYRDWNLHGNFIWQF